MILASCLYTRYVWQEMCKLYAPGDDVAAYRIVSSRSRRKHTKAGPLRPSGLIWDALLGRFLLGVARCYGVHCFLTPLGRPELALIDGAGDHGDTDLDEY
jgi:hypothetical protein